MIVSTFPGYIPIGGQQVKTINNASLIGSGNIPVATINGVQLFNQSTAQTIKTYYYGSTSDATKTDYLWVDTSSGQIKYYNGTNWVNSMSLKNVGGQSLYGSGDVTFKTVNGNNIVGSGDITITTGITNAFVVSTNTPSASDRVKLWVDTANGLKYWNGSAWALVPVAFTN